MQQQTRLGACVVACRTLAALLLVSIPRQSALSAPRSLDEVRPALMAGSFMSRQDAALELATAGTIPVEGKVRVLTEALASEVAHPTSRRLVSYAPETEVLRGWFSHLSMQKLGPAAVPELTRLSPGQTSGVRIRMLGARAILGDDSGLPALLTAIRKTTDMWDLSYAAWVFLRRPYGPAVPALTAMLATPGWTLPATDIVNPVHDPRWFPWEDAIWALRALSVAVDRSNGIAYSVADPDAPTPVHPVPPERAVSVTVMWKGQPVTDAGGQPMRASAVLLPGQHLLLPASFLNHEPLRIQCQAQGAGLRITRPDRSYSWTPAESVLPGRRPGLPAWVEPSPLTRDGELFVPVTALYRKAIRAAEWEAPAGRLWLWD